MKIYELETLIPFKAAPASIANQDTQYKIKTNIKVITKRNLLWWDQFLPLTIVFFCTIKDFRIVIGIINKAEIKTLITIVETSTSNGLFWLFYN